jgi:hypothetical protein
MVRLDIFLGTRFFSFGGRPQPGSLGGYRHGAISLNDRAVCDWQPLLLCALRTGMPSRELLALRWADVRRVHFHDLRHTFASWLIQQSESLPYVRDQLGHKSNRDHRRRLRPLGARRQSRRSRSARRRATKRSPRATSSAGRGGRSKRKCLGISGEPGRNRTVNPQIKSPILPGENTKELSNSAKRVCRTWQRAPKAAPRRHPARDISAGDWRRSAIWTCLAFVARIAILLGSTRARCGRPLSAFAKAARYVRTHRASLWRQGQRSPESSSAGDEPGFTASCQIAK